MIWTKSKHTSNDRVLLHRKSQYESEWVIFWWTVPLTVLIKCTKVTFSEVWTHNLFGSLKSSLKNENWVIYSPLNFKTQFFSSVEHKKRCYMNNRRSLESCMLFTWPLEFSGQLSCSTNSRGDIWDGKNSAWGADTFETKASKLFSHFSYQLFIRVFWFSSSYEMCLPSLQMSVRIKGSYLALNGWNICLDTWELSVHEWCRNLLWLVCFRPMSVYLANHLTWSPASAFLLQITSEVHLFSHIKGKRHQQAVRDSSSIQGRELSDEEVVSSPPLKTNEQTRVFHRSS